LYGEQMAIEVFGGKKVQGTIKIQGSKNAVLPIIAATVLCEGQTVIENCPDITDVHAMTEVLCGVGGKAKYKKHQLVIDTSEMASGLIEEDKVKEIRASILLLGSMLARFNKVKIHYPGGCSIGSRPINFHLQAFRKMGVKTKEYENFIVCEMEHGLCGAEIELEFPSVGTTENILLAAVLAKGTTHIKNAAREPEIVELCRFLCAMGAKIAGAGTNHIVICGVKKLQAIHWKLGMDRIGFLTYAMLVAGCGGEAMLLTDGCVPEEQINVLRNLGCKLCNTPNEVWIQQSGMPRAISYICTEPYPGYPTDGQSLLMSVLSKSRGVSTIEEGIFENRFRMIKQLHKMGANIDYVSNRASITGVTKLHGAKVYADDLRSGAGLLIAAAMAEGESEVHQEKYIYRGYEDVVGNLQQLGINAKERK